MKQKVTEFSTKHFVSVASPYVSAYAYSKRHLDKDFGIRKDPDGTFRIGNSIIDIDQNSNIYVLGKMYKELEDYSNCLPEKRQIIH